MLVTKPLNDTNPLYFTITLPTGKTFVDISDVVFIVKRHIEDDLSDAEIQKFMSDGDIVLEGSDQIRVNFSGNEYTGLTVGRSYVAGLFCKFNGQTDFDERIDTFDFKVNYSMHNQLI